MRIRELHDRHGLELLHEEFDDVELQAAYTSDLLSDVVAHAPEDSVLITIQAHRNTVAVAVLAGIRAILIGHDRPVQAEMLDAARAERIAILRTPDDQFTASWRLHEWMKGVHGSAFNGSRFGPGAAGPDAHREP